MLKLGRKKNLIIQQRGLVSNGCIDNDDVTIRWIKRNEKCLGHLPRCGVVLSTVLPSCTTTVMSTIVSHYCAKYHFIL